MATQQEFINEISKFCQRYAKQYGHKFASPAIAQACLESSYGTSSKAKHHNYFGLKYKPGRVTCNNGTFIDGSKEQNTNGTFYDITSSWYNFDNMAHGVEGYYQFINTNNYAKLKNAGSALEYLQLIRMAGYATDLNYVQKVYNIIQKWNLTQYDNFSTAEKNTKDSTIDIKNCTSINKTTIKNNRKIEWIVVHYTAGTKSVAGVAQNTANYFKTSSTQASADFIVDDATIVQYNGDIENRYCWAVGGSLYSKKYTSLAGRYYSLCKNANSISVEMCSTKTNTKTLSAEDQDWYITEATQENAVKLIKYLMQKYNIDINHVIMHHEVTGKLCPQPCCLNENRLKYWNEFKAKLYGGNQAQTTPVQTKNPEPAAAYLVVIDTDTLNVRKGPGTKYPITTQVKRGSIYTIVEEQNGWGRLKSGAGWIALRYTKKK